MLAWEYRDARHRRRGCEGVVTPRRMKLSRSPPHDSMHRPLSCVQLRAAAAAVLPVAVASQP
eukprot:5572585-Prymnesium_polylepis.1